MCVCVCACVRVCNNFSNFNSFFKVANCFWFAVGTSLTLSAIHPWLHVGSNYTNYITLDLTFKSYTFFRYWIWVDLKNNFLDVQASSIFVQYWPKFFFFFFHKISFKFVSGTYKYVMYKFSTNNGEILFCRKKRVKFRTKKTLAIVGQDFYRNSAGHYLLGPILFLNLCVFQWHILLFMKGYKEGFNSPPWPHR